MYNHPIYFEDKFSCSLKTVHNDEITLANQKMRKLTSRELEILHFIVFGKSNKIIALELGISQRTVDHHRANILLKTGCESEPALTCLFLLTVKKCLKHCLITQECNQKENDCLIKDRFLKKEVL